MSTSLSFYLFGKVFYRKKANQRRISDSPTSSMIELLLTIEYQEIIKYWQNHPNLDDVGIVYLSLYAIISCCNDKIGSIEEGKDP